MLGGPGSEWSDLHQSRCGQGVLREPGREWLDLHQSRCGQGGGGENLSERVVGPTSK